MKNTIIGLCSVLAAITAGSCAGNQGTTTSARKTSDITGKTWKLTEINGKPIALTNPKANPHFMLNTANMRYTGHGGCNGIGGTFEIKQEAMRIKFNQGISTMIACDDLATERAFTQALLTADNYSVNGDTLMLNKARMAPLAKFVVQE